MPNAALVLSGGGAKGAFQAGAEKVCREQGAYDWRVIAGVSVGALNGVMLAMERYERLEELWHTITAADVYRRDPTFVVALRLLFGARGLYNNRALRKLIERELDPARIRKEVIIGTVSLPLGQYQQFNTSFAQENPEAFKDAVFASTCIPVLWPPAQVGDAYQDMVDGGLRNLSPLGDVLDYEPDEVVIINTEPRRKGPVERPLANIIQVAERSLGIMLDEIFQSDLGEFLRINDLVGQAEAQGITLRKEDGTAFKRYRVTIIEPEATLGSTLDFSRASLEAWWSLGQQRAQQALSHNYAPTTVSRSSSAD